MQGLSVSKVAPYMGAWIEISLAFFDVPIVDVAPYMGAWIEIQTQTMC